jgi:hypothetical protein
MNDSEAKELKQAVEELLEAIPVSKRRAYLTRVDSILLLVASEAADEKTEGELAACREALAAILDGPTQELAYVHSRGERAHRVAWDTEEHSQTAEAFSIGLDYETDARYQYPARERLTDQVARLALSGERGKQLENLLETIGEWYRTVAVISNGPARGRGSPIENKLFAQYSAAFPLQGKAK